ncbi:DNA polymerase III subunit beta [Hyphomonas sp.]|uniref:DNA polymerase III subunit beta n=1 Tax=Hyphomonas sp. TaxID=87 RepID=UPI0025C25918|nr:DNA polymerase III subunit beta [Hyphomonas sp.]MBI1401439.1 DNA polymerase III subunit beta [Hyphomonas sp.]
MAKAKAAHTLAATVEAGEFARRLGFVTGAIARRNTIPILGCVLLEAREGLIRLSATNLDQQSDAETAADVKIAGKVCIDAGRLSTIISRMSGELLITLDDRVLKLSAGRARAEMPTLPAEDFQGLRGPEDGDTIEIASGALAAGLASVMHCASTEDTRYYLNGVYVQPDGGALIFTATDGHRLASLRVTAGLPDGLGFDPFILPRAVLRDYCKFCERVDGPLAMTVADNRLQLSAHGETHITKLIDGTFPDYERVFPKAPGASLTLPVADLKAAVAVAMTGTEEKSRAVRFDAEEGRLVCRSGREADFAEAFIEGVDIAPVDPFGLNGKYVLDALEACGGAAEVELIVIDPASPVRILAGDQLRQCVMPLRV